ncbi:MAG: cation diffusion facilitator family transporter [Desulfobacterales bacterium]|nr:cation diffusion facilitator family transporter [Desulfobacterales bacterium]
MKNDEDSVHEGKHQHIDSIDSTGFRLLITLMLNFIIPVIQLIGGVYANSMALISDATHNFSDFIAVLISYVGYRVGQRGASAKHTFGYWRAEIMAALLNVAILVGASVYIVYEASQRLFNPEPVTGLVVVWIAGVGVIGNGFSAWLLHKDARHSLNIRGAFLHMVGDLLTSVAVVVGGMVLIFKPWYWLDPVLSLLIVYFILKNCWGILKEAGGILMNATPAGIDIEEVKETLEQIPGVCGVHYLHAWNLSSSSIAFSCHIVVSDQPVSQTETLARTIRETLLNRFGIDHPVLQFETSQCGNGSTLCEISG